MDKKRSLTGDRPTGNLHIGHYFGSVKSWVELQEKYNSYFMNCQAFNKNCSYNDAFDFIFVSISPFII